MLDVTAEPRTEPNFWQRLNLRQKDQIFGYLFVAPQTIGFLLFVLVPLVMVFVFATQHRNLLAGTVEPAGFANFERMLNDDPFFDTVLRNSLVFATGLVPINIAIALTLSIILTRQMRGAIIFRTLFFAPVITSAVAWAIVWRFLLQGDQGINAFLELVGIDGPNWLREPNWAMFSVIFSRAIKGVGLNMIILMAALQNIPEDYNDAAAVDGANAFQRARFITIPLIMPTLMLVVLITLIGSLKAFDHILLMTQGGPGNATNVLVYYIYFQGFRIFQTGYASSLAVILFAITMTATLVQWLLRRRFSYEER